MNEKRQELTKRQRYWLEQILACDANKGAVSGFDMGQYTTPPQAAGVGRTQKK